MRISGYNGPDGIVPSSGSWTGGYQVVISGDNLCNGSDVTNVTICGVPVRSIEDQTTTQIVVTAEATVVPGIGDIRIYSVSFGETVASNRFSYTGAGIQVDAPAFDPTLLGAAATNIFTVTNTGTEALLITSVTNIGTGAEYFDLSAMPATVEAGSASNFPVVFSASALGSYNPTCYVENNSPAGTNTFDLYGSVYQVSTNNGPYNGGNTIIITNGLLGNGSDITNVIVGGYTATIGSQGSSWVQITLGAGSTNGGAADIVIQSASEGETTFADAYTYNPAGVIAGSSVTQAYVVGTGSLTNAAGSSGYSPIMFYYYSSHYQFLYNVTNLLMPDCPARPTLWHLGLMLFHRPTVKHYRVFLCA